MIKKENGLRYAKLIHVSVDNGKTDNSNKVYIMEEQSDGRIKCEYGRVGKDLAVDWKPSHKWDSVYRQKTSASKGYTDVTDMMVTAIETAVKDGKKADVKEIDDAIVKKLIDDLMAFANKSIQQNYKVTQDAVTALQVSSAQEILTEVMQTLALNADVKLINEKLLKLYTIIPRKMANVKDFLLSPVDTPDALEKAQRFVSNEQDTLDTMAGQVKLLEQQKAATEETDDDTPTSDVTILDQIGLTVEVETDKDTIDLIHKLLGSNKDQAKKIFKVSNKKTQETFDNHFKNAKVPKKRFYWHGSRNENWFNILQTGLMIRPSGAVHTGSMFGDGIYFANKAQKSLGYSSLRGSYWTKGGDERGYLALFDVHLGNQKHITNHDSSCYKLSQSVIEKDGFDSVYAHGGADLRNDEFIIYNKAQCTVAYLIEMRN